MQRVLVIYHGGEPLLFGVNNIIKFSENIRKHLDTLKCQVDFGIQTNGTLLKEEHLQKLEEHNISVSLSIDGPKEMHDQHRLDLKNRPTFDKAYAALLLLKKYPQIFKGCIAVINPYFEPRKLFEFFNDNGIAEFNILIPDANYISLPLGRKEQPNLYKKWLIEAFDCWFDEFSHIKCKYFDWLLMSILGHASETDSFGLGDISLLVVETDGTYHNHDVLKITEENSSSLGLSLENNPIQDVENAEKIKFHRHLLTKEGLGPICQACKHVDVCGGGFIAHRFSQEGYRNPSIYCEEIYSLIDHITARLSHKLHDESRKQGTQLLPEFDSSEMQAFWDCETSRILINKLQEHSARKNYVKLQSIIPYALNNFPHKSKVIEDLQLLSFEELKPALLEPTTIAWLRAIYGHSINSPVTNIVEQELPPDPHYFDDLYEFTLNSENQYFVIQSPNRWYHFSLGNNIILEHPTDVFQKGLKNLQDALSILRNYNLNLYNEMLLVSRHIQLIKDAKASPDKDVSLSDVTLPGAIFIGAWKSNGLLCPYMMSASLIHEHLHQKLYLLQNRFELFCPQETLIYSPWPKVHRPPAGALHAVYVFTHVAHFWNTMLDQNQVPETAEVQLKMDLERLEQCINEIKSKVAFTSTGQLFFNCLLEKFEALCDRNLSRLI